MILLGRIVELAGGMDLADYAGRNIFAPLGMNDTGFTPPPGRCAPTAPDLQGIVHDPLARSYRTADRLPGNAGLFSTGDDLAVFCQALLKGRILKPETRAQMFDPGLHSYGLGWDVFDDAPFKGGVGHTGFTGTLLWIDPIRARFVVILTNRILNGAETSVTRLRKEVLTVVNR
jgi:CubicO group peptidase (beta-lactamase class C family)